MGGVDALHVVEGCMNTFLNLFLVFLNGFFVASEFAIVKIRASQIEVKLRQGSRLAALAKDIHNHMDAYLSAVQLGITLSSLGLGWIGEKTVAKGLVLFVHWAQLSIPHTWIDQLAFPIAFFIITILHIVLGELVPKSLAIQHPVQTTFIVAIPLKLFYKICWPFIFILNGSALLVLKLIGIRPSKNQLHTTDEIRILLEQSNESGSIEDSEHDIIRNVFFSSTKTVKQIMVPHLKI